MGTLYSVRPKTRSVVCSTFLTAVSMPFCVFSLAMVACSAVYVLVLSIVSSNFGLIFRIPFSVASPTFSAVFCTAEPVFFAITLKILGLSPYGVVLFSVVVCA